MHSSQFARCERGVALCITHKLGLLFGQPRKLSGLHPLALGLRVRELPWEQAKMSQPQRGCIPSLYGLMQPRWG